ncbi:MAG TPA: ABC transporter permease [Candidatus Angelobacter sp.]|nr:ABC transporter permease [Candidatus Angelobacter sp.]
MVYFQEIVQAVRALRRTTGFTFVAVAILAVGIASNTVVFSVINAALLRPLPYPNPAQLTVVNWYSSGKLISPDISASAFFLLQDRARSFESLAAMSNVDAGVNLSGFGKPQYVRGFHVSGAFFATLDVALAMGRSFSLEEEQPGGSHAVVLSHGLWVQHFNQDSSVIGRQIRVDGELYTVVGIMPARFRSYPEADLWLPLQLSPATADPGNEYRVIGRLKKGVTLEDAQHELDFSQEYRLTFPLRSKADQVRLVLSGLQSSMVSDVRGGLALLFGAVLFVLLITCTNLAVLLTVRAAGRMREVAIRLALGASRACLARMFLLESLIIAGLGGIAGIILAKEAIPFVLLLAPADASFTHGVSIDGKVVLFTALASMLTALAFGAAPALKMAHVNLNELLRQTTSNATSGSHHARLSRILISAQAALTIVLLTAAGMLLSSFVGLHSVPPGFDPRHLWAAQLSLASRHYQTTSSSAQLLDQLCEKIRSQPGIEAAATITGLPLERGLNLVLHPTRAPGKTVYAEYRIVSPDYFRTMRIPITGGRSFSSGDFSHDTPVAMVNQTLARQWWPGDSPLGRYVAVNSTMDGLFSDAPRQIVGVVADVHESALSIPPAPTIFVPLDQTPDSITAFTNRTFLISILVRTANGVSPAESVRDLLNSADPDLPVTSVRPLSEILSASLSRQRFYTSLIAGFGIFALLLTAIGLYGLLSYQIVLRTREIGVRMAVGAPRFEVVFMIVKQGVGLVLLGALLGMLAVPLETKVLSTMLYNVRGATYVVLVGAVVVLGAVSALSSLLSAVRAASIEPAVTLTAE